MDSIIREPDARSRKSETVLLQAVARVGLKPIADAIGVDTSTVSRTDWRRVALQLTALGLKPVPVNAKCVTPERAQEIEEEIERLRYFAKRGLAKPVINLPDPESDTGLHFE